MGLENNFDRVNGAPNDFENDQSYLDFMERMSNDETFGPVEFFIRGLTPKVKKELYNGLGDSFQDLWGESVNMPEFESALADFSERINSGQGGRDIIDRIKASIS